MIKRLPGLYYVYAGINGGNRYSYLSIPSNYYIVNGRYDFTLVAEKLDKEIVGTVELVTPATLTLNNGVVAKAATTPTQNIWSADLVMPGGTDIVLKATPQNGYRLVKWIIQTPNETTEYPATSNTLSYRTLANDTTITAVFEYTQYRLYYNAAGGGTVKTVGLGVKNGAVVQPGATYTFEAKPNPGYHFVEWILYGSTKSNFLGNFDPSTGISQQPLPWVPPIPL